MVPSLGSCGSPLSAMQRGVLLLPLLVSSCAELRGGFAGPGEAERDRGLLWPKAGQLLLLLWLLCLRIAAVGDMGLSCMPSLSQALIALSCSRSLSREEMEEASMKGANLGDIVG